MREFSVKASRARQGSANDGHRLLVLLRGLISATSFEKNAPTVTKLSSTLSKGDGGELVRVPGNRDEVTLRRPGVAADVIPNWDEASMNEIRRFLGDILPELKGAIHMHFPEEAECMGICESCTHADDGAPGPLCTKEGSAIRS